MRTALLVTCCCLIGCGLPPSEDPKDLAEAQQEIVGGATDTGDPAVVALTVQGQEYCTGTLIGPKTVLTAAHCINVYGASSQVNYYVAFGTYASQPSQRVKIISQTADPQYNKASGDSHDFGILQLATPVTNVAPIEMNALAMNATHVGLAIRHAGFGITSGNGSGGGTKRQVSYTVRQVSEFLIESGANGKQTCSGDSGGPAFMVMPGNTVETLVGVVSFGDEACTQFGADGRIDVVLPWIKSTMAVWEAASCGLDNKCKAGCTPIDQDCACAADGACTADCVDLKKDPDCPVACVGGNTCATEACPRPDPDCIPEGGTCTNASQCKGQVCISDDQHPNVKYCSTACTPSNNTCITGMECAPQLVCLLKQKPTKEPGDICTAADFCTHGGVCAGPVAANTQRCVSACIVQGDCAAGTTCEGGAGGQRFCRAPESVLRFQDIVLERATAEGKAAATGCAATGFSDLSILTALLGGLSLIRRRRS